MPQQSWFREAAVYVMERTRYIIETFGPRDPGSPGETNAFHSIQPELLPLSDRLALESYTIAPMAFMAFIPIDTILLFLALVLYPIQSELALIPSACALIMTFLHFGRYKRFLDPFFPKRTSHNLLAVRNAAKTPQRRIILSGHMDAAYEWRYNLMGHGMLQVVAGAAIFALVYIFLIDLVSLIAGAYLNIHANPYWCWIQYSQYIFLPLLPVAFLFTRYSVAVPGANDNLTGTFCAMAIFKHLHKHNIRFDHTEVWCLITGSEEVGLRGAKAFVEAHADELKSMETVFLALETFHDTEYLSVLTKDLNGLVRHHPQVNQLMRDAAQRCGIPLKDGSVYLGATDAVAFTQAGIPATGFGAMDPAPPQYYHTRLDNWDNMNQECIERALQVTHEAVLLYDENGLPEMHA